MKQYSFQLRVEPGRGRLRNLAVGLLCLLALPLLMFVGLTFWFAALVLGAAVVAGALVIGLVRRLMRPQGDPHR